MSDERNTDGTFAAGNPGGPGRPRRAVESEYLGIVAEVVPLARWQRIVEAAASLAEQGDGKARDWISGYVLNAGQTLWELARRDVLGVAVDDELAAQAQIDSRTLSERMYQLGEPNALETAIATAQAVRDEASGKAERERKEEARLIRSIQRKSQ